MAGEVASLGVRVDATGVESTAKSLASLAGEGAKAEKSLTGVEGAAAKTGKSLATLGSSDANNGLNGVQRASESTAASVKKVGDASAKSAKDIGVIDSAAVGAKSSISDLSTAAGLAGKALAAIGIGASVGEFIKMADAATNVTSRLRLVTASASELSDVQAKLFQVAQSSRVSFTDLVGTYAQVARSTKDLGVSQTALLGVIQTISQAVTISGGSAASAQAALVQLSQGFASGALRGEELNSVMEQTPRLAQAIAEGLGVSIGKLREMGAAGELTAQKVLGALEKSAASVATEFGKMTVTVEQATTNATNSVLRLVGAFDKLTGATSNIGGAIQSASKGIDFLATDLEKLGSQGALRDASREVLNLDAAAKRLRAGMQSGVLGPAAQGELDRINARLEEAKRRFRELDQQLSGVRDPRDQTGFTGRGASYANEAARQAKLREDANAFKLNQSGVPASYLKDMKELIRLNQEGVLVGKDYTDALAKQQEVLLKKTGVTKESASAASSEQNSYQSLISRIKEKIAANNEEIANDGKLSEGAKLRIQLQEQLDAGSKKMTASHRANIEAQLVQLDTSEKLHKEWELGKKQAEEYAKQVEAVANSADKLEQQARDIEASNAVFGQSRVAIEKETQAREKRRLAMLKSLGLEGDMTAQLEREIEAREKVIEGLGVQGYKQANAAANELLRNAQATSAAYQDESEF